MRTAKAVDGSTTVQWQLICYYIPESLLLALTHAYQTMRATTACGTAPVPVDHEVCEIQQMLCHAVRVQILDVLKLSLECQCSCKLLY